MTERNKKRGHKKPLILKPPAVTVGIGISVSVCGLSQLSDVQRRALMCGFSEVIGAIKQAKNEG